MAGIRVRDHENFESAMRRFKRVVEKSGVLAEVRKRVSFLSPSARRKKAFDAAVKRLHKKLQREKFGFEKRSHSRGHLRSSKVLSPTALQNQASPKQQED